MVIFNEEGVIKEVVQLGAKGTGKNLFYRLSNSEFHTILVRSEFLVLHEVTDGLRTTRRFGHALRQTKAKPWKQSIT